VEAQVVFHDAIARAADLEVAGLEAVGPEVADPEVADPEVVGLGDGVRAAAG